MPTDLVVLSWSELRRASHVGVDRFVRALSQGRAPTYGAGYTPVPDVVGAWGEAVIAKATGTYWLGDLGHPDAGAADVGPFHVRTTTHPDGCLILHDSDAKPDPFVLVIANRPPQFRIAGWCLGADGQQATWWRTDTGRPAYFVPQSALLPFSEVPAHA